MSECPPLTAPDCDIRGYEFMPLFGHRLFSSEFYAEAPDVVFRTSLKLWWVAWQQCPAASLPDNDIALCHLADLGRDIRKWREIRDQVLRGFVKCSDGRLYHPFLAREATLAYDRRVKDRLRKQEMRDRKSVSSEGPDGSEPMNQVRPADRRRTGQGRDAEVLSDRTRQDKTGQNMTRHERTVSEDELSRTPNTRGSGSKPTKACGMRLPLQWGPTQADVDFAESLGLDVPGVHASFRDYWHSASGGRATKLDWSAAWRIWCRKERPQQLRGQQPISKLGHIAKFAPDLADEPVTLNEYGEAL